MVILLVITLIKAYKDSIADTKYLNPLFFSVILRINVDSLH